MKISGGLIQIPIVKKASPAKQEWSTDAYSSLFVTIHYTLFDFVGHPIFQLESILMAVRLNQTLWRNVHLETACSHNAVLLSVMRLLKSYPFLCNMVKMQTLHGHSKYSGRLGFAFLQIKHAHKQLEL